MRSLVSIVCSASARIGGRPVHYSRRRERSSSHRGKRAHASGCRRRQQFGERAARTRDVGRRASTRARAPAGRQSSTRRDALPFRRQRCSVQKRERARAARARSGRHDRDCFALFFWRQQRAALDTARALHRSRTPALSPRGTAARICCYTHTQQSVR